MIELTKYADRSVIAAQRGIIIASSLMLTGLMVAEIVWRYLLNMPLLWQQELALITVMWLYMMGVAAAGFERSHLKTEIVQVLLKDPRKLRIIEALATLITVVMAGFMVYWSSDLFLWGLQHHQVTPIMGIPWVAAQSSLFLTGILLFIYFLRELLDRIRHIFITEDPASVRLG